MPKREINELKPGLLGPSSLNPFPGYTSSSRQQMFAASHLGQMLVIDGSTPRNVFTGMERKYGKYTFCVEMPTDGQIVAIIPRYPATIDGGIKHNPETLVIYEEAETKVLNCFSLVDYCSYHQYFGFKYKKGAGLSQLRVGAYIAKGTKFLQSPNIGEDGDYNYGLQANVAYLTIPGVAEDGVVVSESFLQRLKFKTYVRRTVEWGSDKLPLNLYGTEDNPQQFPNIGEKIRDDGILMGLRPYDPANRSPLLMLPKMLMQPRVDFDHVVYADGKGGTVIDIKIDHVSTNRSGPEENPLDAQALRYDTAKRTYYQAVQNVYDEIKRRRNGDPVIGRQFGEVLEAGLAVLRDAETPRVVLQHRRTPLDVFKIEFTIEYTNTPNIGYKLTDCYGGKGVICKILPDSDMPMDEDGNVAEVAMDPNSTINRANPGRLYEQFFNASARDFLKRISADVNIPIKTKASDALRALQALPQEVIDRNWEALMRFYDTLTPTFADGFKDGRIQADPREYISELLEIGKIAIFFPSDNPVNARKVLRALQDDPMFRPTYGRITYVGNSGKRRSPKNPIRIAEVYMILLEKTGEDWGAVSSSALQHHGLLAPQTRSNRHRHPARLQPVRGTGEAEFRIITAYCGGDVAAEIHDRNNNVAAHVEMVRQLIRAEKPSAIDTIVDRSRFPYGMSQPHIIVNHLLYCSGLKFVHEEHIPAWQRSPDSISAGRTFELVGEGERETEED